MLHRSKIFAKRPFLRSIQAASLPCQNSHSQPARISQSFSHYTVKYNGKDYDNSIAEDFSSNTQDKASFSSEFISIDHNKGVRFVTLTREKALNALNHDMIRQMMPVYRAYNSDPSTTTIVLKAPKDSKAFCAGGDIKYIVQSKDHTFFKDEYALDTMIAKLGKPHIAIWDGIVMGGGVGISVHGAFRIATENTLFSMPETQIGFFPDVGGSYFLPRLKNNYGFYLGLTGKRLKGQAAFDAGIANYFIPSEKLENLEKLLVRMNSNSPVDIRNCIRHIHPQEPNDIPDAQEIGKIFDPDTHETVEDIIADLEKSKAEWAQEALKSLKRASPTSLKVTYEQLKRGATLSIDECFKMEYLIAQNMLLNHDFPEGVDKTLVKKGEKPEWQPTTLEGVTKEQVESYFREPETQEQN